MRARPNFEEIGCYHQFMVESEKWAKEAEQQLKEMSEQVAENRRELLLAFYQHLIDNDPFPINSSSKEREVDRFLKALNR